MKEKVLKLLLKRFIDGRISERESELLDSWYKSFDSEDKPMLTENKKTSILQNINHKISIDSQDHARLNIRRIIRRSMQIAAGLLLCFGIFFLYKQQNEKQSQLEVKVLSQIQIFETKVGERSRIDLPDGSWIILYPKSIVKFDLASFNKKDRNIELIRGDIFCQVKPDSSKPFIVKAEKLSTRVLGTSFLVSSYPELIEQKVSVYTGLVEVSQSGKKLARLKKGNQLTFDKSIQQERLSSFDLNNLESREYGKIQLKQARFDELAVQFENYFGIKIKTTSSKIKTQLYTLPIDKEHSIDNMLTVIAALHHNKFRKEGDVVIFY